MKRADPSPQGARYLDLLALNKGDLILSRGSDRVSKIIARQSDGPFSHVAIVRGMTQRIEALDDGVGLTNHKVDRIEKRGGRLRLMMKVEDDECLVLRHKGATLEDEEARSKYER